jgi:hypothetical protein
MRVDDVPGSAELVLQGLWPRGRRPGLWDGHTAARTAGSLREAVRAGLGSR